MLYLLPTDKSAFTGISGRAADGFHGTFTMGTGGHYITMLPAYWSISTSHDPFALQFLW